MNFAFIQTNGVPAGPPSPQRADLATMTANSPFSEFTSVSCTAATACTMVGFYFTTADKTLTETWNGSSWKVAASPNPAGSTLTSLHGVWCNSTKDCWAVGLHQQKAGQNSTLAEHWNGNQWSIVSTP